MRIKPNENKTDEKRSKEGSLQLDQPVQASQLIVPHFSVLNVSRSLREGHGTATLNGL
jgi:hypothetical protein